MSTFINSSRKLINSCLNKTSLTSCQNKYNLQKYCTKVIQNSPLESNIIRLLRNRITYQTDYAPPHLPAEEFNSFTVEDRPREQWVTMEGKYGENETIKIEATMFDGSAMTPKSGDNYAVEDVSLHISMLVDISRGEGRDMEFVCSAWPDHIEIQKVYIFSRDKSVHQPYMGPNFRNFDTKLQNTLTGFLKERGVNDDVAAFLHEFMMNKERAELVKWFRTVKSFVEK